MSAVSDELYDGARDAPIRGLEPAYEAAFEWADRIRKVGGVS